MQVRLNTEIQSRFKTHDRYSTQWIRDNVFLVEFHNSVSESQWQSIYHTGGVIGPKIGLESNHKLLKYSTVAYPTVNQHFFT